MTETTVEPVADTGGSGRPRLPHSWAPRRWRLLAVVTAGAVVVAAAGVYAFQGCREPVCTPTRYPSGGIDITSGNDGGVYAAYASAYREALAESMPGLKVRLTSSPGSVGNIERLAEGTAQLGFISADTAYQVDAAEKKANNGIKIRAIARIYDEYVQLVVRNDGPIHTLADLRGRRVGIGAAGSSVEVTARRLLAAGQPAVGRVKQLRLGVDDSATALEEHRIDAFFWVGGLPTGAMSRLAHAVTLRLVPLDQNVVNTLSQKWGTFYRQATVPANTYPKIATDDHTVAVPSYLLTTTAVDDSLVYRLTASLFAHRTQISGSVPSGRLLDTRTAITTAPIPLHDGALRYYRQVKP